MQKEEPPPASYSACAMPRERGNGGAGPALGLAHPDPGSWGGGSRVDVHRRSPGPDVGQRDPVHTPPCSPWLPRPRSSRVWEPLHMPTASWHVLATVSPRGRGRDPFSVTSSHTGSQWPPHSLPVSLGPGLSPRLWSTCWPCTQFLQSLRAAVLPPGLLTRGQPPATVACLVRCLRNPAQPSLPRGPHGDCEAEVRRGGHQCPLVCDTTVGTGTPTPRPPRYSSQGRGQLAERPPGAPPGTSRPHQEGLAVGTDPVPPAGARCPPYITVRGRQPRRLSGVDYDEAQRPGVGDQRVQKQERAEGAPSSASAGHPEVPRPGHRVGSASQDAPA